MADIVRTTHVQTSQRSLIWRWKRMPGSQFELGHQGAKNKDLCSFKRTMEQIGKELESLMNDCEKLNFTSTELARIYRPLLLTQSHRRRRRWPKQWKLLMILLGFVGLIYLIVVNCYHCAWALSAIARLGLIQFLPYWNWTPLYSTKCLIERPDLKSGNSQLAPPSLGRYETDPENCALCETIDRIVAVENITFSYLESHFFERGLPVIVTDSHASRELTDLLDIMQTQTSHFLDSEPCDLATNVMMRKLFNLEVAFEKIRKDRSLRSWFLQFRNCDFQAVRDSRLFITRPYYYPLHLEPFYTSWIIISHNSVLPTKRLYLQGLIFVQQMSGRFSYRLEPKEPCQNSCPTLTLHLKAGECLAFSTDLWIFHYESVSFDENATSIATILEINWML